MSTNDFLIKQNVDLLWEVIIDDDLFKNKPKELINEIGNMFTQTLRGFNEFEKNNSSNLMAMNKKFIGIMLNRSRSIIISNKNPVKSKELITSTDLQTERISQFEKDLSKKQTEFTSAMSLQVPPVPKFSDNNLDEPIGEMELAIKKVVEQRNYDIEQVNKTLNKSNADSWLKPQETSVKSEKIVPLKNQKTDYIQNSHVQNSLKYIKIDENIENTIIKNDIIDLSKQKHISWEDENISLQIVEKEEENDIIENNIFKKLKKITPEVNQEVNQEVNELSNMNNRMNILEDKIEGLNNKLDLIIEILSEK
jgi:hypothetical protein